MTEESPAKPQSHSGEEEPLQSETLGSLLVTLFFILLFWLGALLLTVLIDAFLFQLSETAFYIVYMALVFTSLFVGALHFDTTPNRIDTLALKVYMPKILEQGHQCLLRYERNGFWRKLSLIVFVVVLPIAVARLAPKRFYPEHASPFSEILVVLLAIFFGGACLIVLLSLIAGLWPNSRR